MNIMKSLEYVKQRILSGGTNLNWTAEEIDAAQVWRFSEFMNSDSMPRTFANMKRSKSEADCDPRYKVYISGENDLCKNDISIMEVDEDNPFPDVKVTYTPENDFEYFLSETIEYDGTYAFLLEALQTILYRLDIGSSYNKAKAEKDFLLCPHIYSVSYEVGDAVVISKPKQVTNRFGESFPGERVSICVPAKWKAEKHQPTLVSKSDPAVIKLLNNPMQ